MSDSLPDTDDPFELLGVDPSVDEVGLRRAYSRLARRFRPERAPQEFKRIRAAFDQAKLERQWGRAAAHLEPEPDDPPARWDHPQESPLPPPEAIEALGYIPDHAAPPASQGSPHTPKDELQQCAELGDIAGLRAVLDRPEVRARVFREDDLAYEVSCALVYLAWYDLSAAEQRFEKLGIDPATLTAELAESFDSARIYDDERKNGFECAELRDFMALSHWFMELEASDAATALSTAATQETTRVLLALDRLGRRDPHFWARAFDVVQHWGDLAEDIQFDSVIEEELKRIDGKLESHRIARFENILALLMMGASAAAFARFGWWGIPLFLLVVVAWIWSISKTDVRLYREVVRSELGRFVVRQGVPGERLAKVLGRVTQLADNIGRFKREMRDDWGLVWLGAFGALLRRNEDSTSPPNL